MDLLKKGLVFIVMVLIAQITNGELSKNEQLKAMALQVRLHTIASQSRGKPLPASMRKSVASAVEQLELLEKKNPGSRLGEQAKKYESAIVYASPVQEVLVRRKEKAPSQEELFAREEQEKNAAFKKDFINHVSALQKDETWSDYRPLDLWKQKALHFFTNPMVMNITFNNENAAIALLDTVLYRYNYLMYQAKSEDRASIKEKMKIFLEEIKKEIFNAYSTMVLTKGALWNANTMNISKQWCDNLVQFVCYVLRTEYTDQKLEELQKAVEDVIQQKYTIEDAANAESMQEVKNSMVASLKKCQQEAIAKASQVHTLQQKSKSQFETLMNTIKVARSLTPEQKKKHEDDAFKIASQWLEKVSDNELDSTVSEIKSLYKYALITQSKPWYAWSGMWIGNKDTAERTNQFNERVDQFITQRFEGKEGLLQQALEQETSKQGEASQEEVSGGVSQEILVAPQVPVIEQGGPVSGSSQKGSSTSQPATTQEESAQVPVQLTEEQKKNVVQEYISTLSIKSTEGGGNIEWTTKKVVSSITGEEEEEDDARIAEEWLKGLLSVINKNNIVYNRDEIKTLLQNKFDADWKNNQIKGSYVVEQALNTIKVLRERAEKQEKAEEEKRKVEESLRKYVATLAEAANWEFINNEHRIAYKWLEKLFEVYRSEGITSEQLKQVLSDQLKPEKLPTGITITNIQELVDRVVENMKQNAAGRLQAYGPEGSMAYIYRGLDWKW